MMLSRIQVETALNGCAIAQPSKGYILSPDLSVLATIWALMNHDHRDVQDMAALSESQRTVLNRWLVPADAERDNSTCPLRTPDQSGECEACQ
jgi:hypothetical protein